MEINPSVYIIFGYKTIYVERVAKVKIAKNWFEGWGCKKFDLNKWVPFVYHGFHYEE